MRRPAWLLFALITTLFWGVWGAFIEVPEKAGFPATLGYSVWALTMIPCSLAALALARSALQRSAKQIAYGSAVGLLGAGGQLLLFEALRFGPAYLVFPIISALSRPNGGSRVHVAEGARQPQGLDRSVLAFPAMALLSWQPPSSASGAMHLWLPLTFGVFVAWGIQAYVMKVSTGLMSEESLFFYMMATAVVLIPVALTMTDFSQPINWGWRGPWLAAIIQVLNAMGALSLVYALRHGKAMIVVPMTSLAPVLTVILSLLLYRVIPQPVVVTGLIAASVAIYLMAE